MATTRLMPLHTGKGRTVGQAIRDIIDYTENPQKTDGGRLITSWQCDSRIADAEFLFAKNQYIQKTGRVRGEDDVIAYHQSSEYGVRRADGGEKGGLCRVPKSPRGYERAAPFSLLLFQLSLIVT